MKGFLKSFTLKKIIAYTCALILGAAVSFGILEIMKPDPYAPLDAYPEQQVVTLLNETTPSTDNKNVIIPLISLETKYVFSQGTKCSSENTRVTGTFQWKSTVPGGFVYKAPSSFKEERIKGCQTFTYQNNIPREVYDWANRVIDTDGQPEIFMTGCETPIDRNGKEGTEVCWRSEPFAFKE